MLRQFFVFSARDELRPDGIGGTKENLDQFHARLFPTLFATLFHDRDRAFSLGYDLRRDTTKVTTQVELPREPIMI